MYKLSQIKCENCTWFQPLENGRGKCDILPADQRKGVIIGPDDRCGKWDPANPDIDAAAQVENMELIQESVKRIAAERAAESVVDTAPEIILPHTLSDDELGRLFGAN